MGAFWHIALPVAVRFQNKPEITEIFTAQYGEDYVEEYHVQSPRLRDGTQLTFSRCENVYRLNAQVRVSELREMYSAFFETVQAYTVL